MKCVGAGEVSGRLPEEAENPAPPGTVIVARGIGIHTFALIQNLGDDHAGIGVEIANRETAKRQPGQHRQHDNAESQKKLPPG